MNKYRVLLAATLGCALAMPVVAAPSPEAEKASAELKAALRQHHEALNKQDIKALMALYADDPSVAVMGTGPGEFWKGKAVVEETYKHFFETFKAGSLSHECPDVSGGEDGSSAWLMASCIMKDTTPDGKEPREFGLNVSAVLKKDKAGWKFQAMHFSNLSGDEGPPPEEDKAAAPAAAP
ncbi:MAG: nuclear transport factor 2 family protein, partial [Candidatus Contendobacter sp.]|nr:nuclear transport factor 2 family protein [Candidatus Contendobacter sp.]